ncbi:hypothetical protein OPT61_g4988 [Boeremia exigua]|uniref:Uncharacterized protein n=1 Tax=Boeremia exigua TaxID=749465 RepID=A0ACC2IC13_9PLEO|nr:hypothetical protein OPT61_g4988 [Boeremia exigua]
MPESDLFPVICSAEIPNSVGTVCPQYLPPTQNAKSLIQDEQKTMETFLKDAYTGSEQLVPGTPPRLVILTSTNTSNKGSHALSSSASQPPLQSFTSPFLGQSVEDAAQHPVIQKVGFFAVLDERSARDGTALLAACEPNSNVSTVRVIFSEVQRSLISISIGSIGFAEIQNIAASQGNEGIYGAPDSGQGPRKGGQAPRKKLGE